jgi:hypothetical protein
MRCQTAKRKVGLIFVVIIRLRTNDDHEASTQGSCVYSFDIGINYVSEAASVSAII